MLQGEFEELVEERVTGGIQVVGVGQNTRGLRGVHGTPASPLKVVYQVPNTLGFAAKVWLRAPLDEIAVSIDLYQPRERVGGARIKARQAAVTPPRQRRHYRFRDVPPRRHQDGFGLVPK